jgi:[ribosomal protein S18]-alanine N-acetyltransferase
MTTSGGLESRHIRQLDKDDHPACVALSKRSDPHSWSSAIWLRSLQNDHCLAICDGDEILGIAAFGLVLDEVSLLNIVVDRERRGQRIGATLLEAGLEWMQQFGGEHCILEVRKSNVPAIRLYAQLGFREDGVRKNYYPLGDGREDAILMSADLPLGGG